ncbi:HK97-gp10 family putative phage morphogenesis protein [Piscirickettsia salmonis]|uniref:HK97-gp10 family putative phage morphogenesis protein n=1 Tax=Piscirickettsia salmonis TaxID=1238 RepID=UPI0012BAC075|nr:HK97-gp10 family putative phage morphogenesis protein [Piscirickettsia salmonis]
MLGDFASLDVQNTYRGSDAYDAIEQEYGSSHQPARPFIRPALNDNAQKSIDIFKNALTLALKKQKL